MIKPMMTRRELVTAAAGAGIAGSLPLFARNRIDRSRLSALTDEIGKTPEESIDFAHHYRLHWVELRSIPGGARQGSNPEYSFMAEAEVKATAASLARNNLKVSFLNASLLKFYWPGMERPTGARPETEEARTKRLAGEKTRFDRRMEDLRTAIRNAHILGVDKIRVFAGLRVADPETVFPRVIDVIGEMALVAEKEKVKLLLENEAACNVATSAELAEVLKALPSKSVGINWDPQNEFTRKLIPFPDGYNLLPKNRILNVQFKGHGLLDPAERLDWAAIIKALEKDGYQGEVGLETHYFDGTVIEKANAAMREMIRIVEG
jgi:hydroxypyruvate isomerase